MQKGSGSDRARRHNEAPRHAKTRRQGESPNPKGFDA